MEQGARTQGAQRAGDRWVSAALLGGGKGAGQGQHGRLLITVLVGIVGVAMKTTLIPTDLGTIKMAQWMKPEDLSSIPRTHTVREHRFLQVVL